MNLLRLNYLQLSQLHLLDTMNFILIIMIVHILQFDDRSIHMKWNCMDHLDVINNEAMVSTSNHNDACNAFWFRFIYKYSNNKNKYKIYAIVMSLMSIMNHKLQLPNACNICKIKNISIWHLSCTNNALRLHYLEPQILIRKYWCSAVYYIQVILIKHIIRLI